MLDGFIIEGEVTATTIWTGGNGVQILSNLIIRNNKCQFGGILYSEADHSDNCMTKLFNVEFSYNEFPANGYLISNSQSSMELYNVTIAYNNIRYPTRKAFNVDKANFHIYNSIIWKTGGYNFSSGSASMTNCLTEVSYNNALPTTVVKNNVITAANAGFVYASNMPIGDFRLTATSPAVDAGDYFLYEDAYNPYTIRPYTSVSTTFCYRDLDGLTRWEGNGIDLGAYEYDGISFRTPQMDMEEDMEPEFFALQQEPVLYPTSVCQQGTVYLEHAGNKGTVRVYSSNGACVMTETVADGNAILTAPQQAGMYIVVVTAQDGHALYNGKLVVTP